MIRILMLDLGETLVHENTLFPHVHEALNALNSFETAAGEPLAICLVSNFHMPLPPPTQEKIEVIFQNFLSILERFNLKEFFEPVSERVTLSTHAGVVKPDPKVFEVAINRLGLKVDFKECLFITEDPAHICKCKKNLGMSTLQFGDPGSKGIDFSDWSEAPLLIARVIAPNSNLNLELALRTSLSINHQINLTSIKEIIPSKKTIYSKARTFFPIADPKLGQLDGVCIEIPANLIIQLNEHGQIKSLNVSKPSEEVMSEVKYYLQTLLANQQVSLKQGKLSPGETHQIEVDSKGRRLLKRKRFTAS